MRAEQVVGGYRLLFELTFVPVSWDSGQVQGHVPYLTSLRLVVELNGILVGTALPEEEDFLAPIHPQARNAPTIRRTFALNIDPRALDKIEQKREAQDIAFDLQVIGTGTVFALQDEDFQNLQRATSLPEPLGVKPLHFEPRLAKADIRYQVPQSDWIDLLKKMDYARIMLYEIPWPKSDDDKLNEAISRFENARHSFLSGFYTHAVGELRESLDCASEAIVAENPVWKKVADKESRESMSLSDRFLLAWHAARHLTHPAHHSGNYSMEEARYILGMGALALSLAANAPGVLKEASEGRSDAD